MKKGSLITLIILMFSGQAILAGPGDTIVVQTIDFNTPVLSWWNAPRDGTYLFPPDTMSFEKILMYYTLKCDPGQFPACGEWDYTTYTNLLFHTGEYDSTLFTHPNFIVNGQTPDTFMYMDQASWSYHPYFEPFNQTSPNQTATIGAGTSSTALASSGIPDSRHAYLVTAAELSAAGLPGGDITGLRLNTDNNDSYFRRFTVRIKATDSTELTPSNFNDQDFQTVFSRNTTFTANSWNILPFAFPFNWNGTGNLIVDISYADHTPDISSTLLSDATAFHSGITAGHADSFLDFEGTDAVEIPIEAFEDLDSMVTVSFWQYGDPVKQPQNDVIFAAVDHNNNRILNVHLPWSDSKVYWDAGFEDGYDRISRGAPPEDFKGQWNHWAFTKNCETGRMAMYLNGVLWFQGIGKTKLMDSIAGFTIGAYPGFKNFYDGYIDEFRVWNRALEPETIQEWMFREVDNTHPYYNNLLAYYKFDEGNGLVTAGEVNDDNGTLTGYPLWLGYQGSDRFKGFIQSDNRPQMIFEQGSYNAASLDSVLSVDTLALGQLMIVMYEDVLNPTEPTDTLSKWPSYYDNYVYDGNGIATDSSFVTPDGILYREDHPYYGTPFEVISTYELARYITPYGNGLDLGEGFTWVYDVTDYRPLLVDSVHLRAGNFQELLDLKFYMIEGTPPREVKKIDKLWSGYFKLNTFEQDVPPVTLALDDNTSTYKLKVTTSGHDFDNPTNCAEFCQKTHWVDVDGDTEYSWEILDECADNALYPQGGTWIFDRAGWCPGAKVTERHMEITPSSMADSVELDYNCDYDSYGRYVVRSYFFSYGDPNFTMDAAVEDIMAPNKMKINGRINPICGQPVIKIKNNGETILNTLDIYYGPEGGTTRTYHWTGWLEFMETEEVVLDPIDWTGWNAGNMKFTVTVDNPNSMADEYSYNNSFTSEFELSPEFENQFVLHFLTNKVAWHNRWEITDAEGNIVIERDGFSNETLYVDTLLLDDGCYTFTLWDSGDNGISFWYHSNQGNGYCRFKNMEGNILHYFDPDFGKFTSLSFTVGMAVSTRDLARHDFVDIYPNPTSGVLNVSLALQKNQDVNVEVFTLTGKMVFSARYENLDNEVLKLDLSHHPGGIFFCKVTTGGEVVTKKIILAR